MTGLNSTGTKLRDPQVDFILMSFLKKYTSQKNKLLHKGLEGNKTEVVPLHNTQF